ncbi:MAG: DM13 domain-containing protein [Oleiphilaceae bacterium]|nr:DM13 domain-containing protein [Oleiphilaceae bacterium]
MKKALIPILLVTHIIVGGVGFGLGIYFLPILTAPPAPSEAELVESSKSASYTATFVPELKGSDRFHWGDGDVSLSPTTITFQGELAPGPDYKLYLTKEFVETEAEFEAIKDNSPQLADIKTFDGFIADIPSGVVLEDYTTVLVWCESFGEFITAAKYRE